MNAILPAEFISRRFKQRARQSWRRKTIFWFGGELPLFDAVAALTVTKAARLKPESGDSQLV